MNKEILIANIVDSVNKTHNATDSVNLLVEQGPLLEQNEIDKILAVFLQEKNWQDVENVKHSDFQLYNLIPITKYFNSLRGSKVSVRFYYKYRNQVKLSRFWKEFRENHYDVQVVDTNLNPDFTRKIIEKNFGNIGDEKLNKLINSIQEADKKVYNLI